MLEKAVEDYLVQRVKDAGGEVRKVKWIGRRGAPDRLVMLNGAHFVEVKRPGQTLDAHQDREHDRMDMHGLSVWCVASFEQVDMFIYTALGIRL